MAVIHPSHILSELTIEIFPIFMKSSLMCFFWFSLSTHTAHGSPIAQLPLRRGICQIIFPRRRKITLGSWETAGPYLKPLSFPERRGHRRLQPSFPPFLLLSPHSLVAHLAIFYQPRSKTAETADLQGTTRRPEAESDYEYMLLSHHVQI